VTGDPRADSMPPAVAAPGLGEMVKLAAFLRRDLLTALTYRAYFVGDFFNLLLEAALFYFIGQLVAPSELPAFGGSRTSYLEFVAIGIIFGTLVQLLSGRMGYAIRQEQLYGTLESLLMTPTSYTTILVGSVVYDLLYLPIRTALFLVVLVATGGVHIELAGILPAAAILLLFLPFVWGLGVATAGATLRFKRGTGGLGFATTLLMLASGAYFPLDVLPHWLAGLAERNPIATALDATREALLGGTGWSALGDAVLPLAVTSLLSLALGMATFRHALRHERKQGTLGFY
jgi:ABC-2 type transport system permease protein